MEDIEDGEFVALEHDRLISAISKLDKTQHITAPTRSEPTIENSEFSLNKRANRLDLNNLAKVLEDSSKNVKISKKLKRSHDKSKVLSKPLEKPQADRLKRATGYDATKKKVGRWDSVVARSRTSEYVVFPIKPVETKLQPTNEFLARFESKSELEKELEEVDPPINVVEEEDEEKTYPMSYEEMVEHRQHLAKLRAQQSYKDAKAKRQSKIKSKKFHRVLKKERLKQQLKEFEELQKTDPEEALKKLEAIEKARAKERHTLRHKNTGKWAKNKMIRAKYDKEVRQQISEQLAVSRSLTQKTGKVDSSDDEADEIIPDLALTQDPLNPWMLKESNKSNVNAEFDFGYKKYLKEKKVNHKDSSDTDSDDETKNIEEGDLKSSVISNLKESINKISQNTYTSDSDLEKRTDSGQKNVKSNFNSNIEEKSSSHIASTLINGPCTENPSNGDIKIMSREKIKNNKAKKRKSNLIATTSNWIVEELNDEAKSDKIISLDISSAFESLERKVVGKVEKKLKTMRKQIANLDKNSKQHENNNSKNLNESDGLKYLQLKNRKQKPIIDEELIETGFKEVGESSEDNISKVVNVKSKTVQKPNTPADIDPTKFIAVKPKYLNTALSQGDNGVDTLDDDCEQVVPRVNIEEVFEEDDVVASFRQEKEDEINKNKPEDIDLSLPGWGTWGGKGVKATKRRRNRFIVKGAPQQMRRDENKGDVIIKEYKDPKLSAHKVKEIPFPFESVNDYEASIRTPLGNTFIPEKAHKKLIRPNVITKAGAIIEPMDEDELLVKKNRNFSNEKVLKMLGQK